jgi:predicted phosphodiesterase
MHFDHPRGVETTVVLSDIHYPYHNVNCGNAVKDFLDDVRPHRLVLAGDILDLYEISHFNKGSLGNLENRRIATTWEVGEREVGQLALAAGRQCRDKIFIPGNHEERLYNWLMEGDHAVFAGDVAFDIPTRLNLARHGYVPSAEHWPNAGVRVGKLWVTHGQFCGLHHAKRHLDKFRHSVMYGHTHSPQTFHASTLDGQQASYGLGWLGDKDSAAHDYADKVNSWVHGFGLVHTWPDGSYTAHQINFWRGMFVYGGRSYGKREAA